MEWLAYVVATVFVLLGAVCVLSIVLSLPGTWVMLALAFIIELADALYLPVDVDGGGGRQTFPWWLLITGAGLALAGELLELVAGAAGARRGGAGKRGIIGALLGGIVGAILLTGLIPIPIVGTLIGALVGSFIGAVIGETSGQQPKTVSQSVKPAVGATIGRAVGTAAKISIAMALWLALSVAAFWV